MRTFPCLAALVMFAGGCLPFATPPLSAALGPSTRVLERDDGTVRIETGGHVEAGLAPMQLIPSTLHRTWEVTMLGALDTSSRDTTWGAGLSTGPIFHPWDDFQERDASMRLLPEVQLRLLADPSRHDTGWGAAVRTTFELATVTRGATFSSSSGNGGIGGVAYGEMALGGYLEASYQDVGALRGWMVSAGVALRLPASAGMVCCFDVR